VYGFSTRITFGGSLHCVSKIEILLYGLFSPSPNVNANDWLPEGILLVLLSAAAHLLYHRTGGAGSLIFATATALMGVLATAQLGIRLRITVLGFKIFRLAVEGEVRPQSARAVDITNSFNTLVTVEDFFLVTNKRVSGAFCFAAQLTNYSSLVTDGLFVSALPIPRSFKHHDWADLPLFPRVGTQHPHCYFPNDSSVRYHG
jgi:hypothetical protein